MRTLYLLFFLNFFCVAARAQTKTITGTVKDAAGEALVGATVSVKGSKAATATNSTGSFTLSVPEKTKTLVITYSGMETEDIEIGTQTSINVAMRLSPNSLNEVVVVGYGTVKRKDLTGAVASVSGKQIAAVPVQNAAQALAGKVPGVNVTAQDGRPDASISIRIRGGGSVSQSNEPLYIVDGFPVSNITDVPSAQIESLDVLKDASSTAIYGARGANGVIIVTTKSGKSGRLRINYDNYFQSNQPTKYLPTMSAYDYIAYNWGYAKAISDSYAGAWEKLWAIGSSAATYNNAEGIDHYKKVDAINYSKQAYKASFTHNHNLSISNGTDKTKYILSISYIDNEGMKINSWFKRANASFKIDQKIASNLTFNFDTRFTDVWRMSNEGTTNGKGSILSSAYQFRPIATKDILGVLDDRINTQLGFYDNVLQDQFNPVEQMKDYLPLARERGLRTNAALSWGIIKGLTARSEFGYNIYWNKSRTWSGATYNNYLDANFAKTFAGNAAMTSAEGWNLRWVNTLTYNVAGLGKAHSLNIVAGTEVNNSYGETMSVSGNRFPVSYDADRAFALIDQYNASTTVTNWSFSSGTSTPSRLNSYFGRANYSLLDKYLLTATFRADGSSRFATKNRWAYFPAAAIAWRVSDEKFMTKASWVSDLKLRFSYGTVGNDAINATQWKTQWVSSGLTQWSISGPSITEVRQSAYAPSNTLGNPDLKWETTITRNLGIDFSFFNKRMYGTVDVYNNNTKDLLFQVNISPYYGVPYQFQNVGSTNNKGIELALGGDIIRKKDFNLSANFNISFNKGKIVELAPGITPLYKSQWGSTVTQPNTGDYTLQVGKPVGQVRGYTYDGWYTPADFTYSNGVYTVDKSKGVPDIGSGIAGTVYGTTNMKPAGQSAAPGVIKFKDLNGDGVVDEKDVTIIGDMTPKHTGGFALNASYKSFDFSANFNWSYGNQVYNANYLAAFTGSKEDGLYKNRLNYLSTSYKIYDIQGGQLVKVTDPTALNTLNANATTFLPYQENPVVSTLGIESGSFLRLNTVTLGYNLPEKLIHRVKMNRLRVFASIYNALTITGYKGLDPEVNTNTTQGGTILPTLGLDWGAYPRARSFTAGINVEF